MGSPPSGRRCSRGRSFLAVLYGNVRPPLAAPRMAGAAGKRRWGMPALTTVEPMATRAPSGGRHDRGRC
ncbi:MAG: hypothetical protein CM15mP18_0880 [Methanobacteriota archaeon]|nr:MAG: hypothetical protein CM15mP18_0880 [Euryarchaeota archaeon]